MEDETIEVVWFRKGGPKEMCQSTLWDDVVAAGFEASEKTENPCTGVTCPVSELTKWFKSNNRFHKARLCVSD